MRTLKILVLDFLFHLNVTFILLVLKFVVIYFIFVKEICINIQKYIFSVASDSIQRHQ